VEDGKVIHKLREIGIPFHDALFHPKLPVVITVAGIRERTRPKLDDPDNEQTEPIETSQGSVMEWNLLRPDEPRTIYDGGVKRLVLSRDARLLAASCMDKKVRIWDLYTADEPKELPQYDIVTDMEFSPDGHLLATQIMALVQIWDLESGKEKFTIGKGQAGLGDRRNLRFSPDGKILSFGNLNGQLVLWDMEKQQPRHTLSLKPTNLYQTAFSANGKLLATADDGYSIRLWDLETGKELHEFRGHTTMLMAIEFIADGKTLASAGYDGAVKLWDVAKWVAN
jgi:WD40 repeat protein